MKRLKDWLTGILLAMALLTLYGWVGANDRTAYCLTHHCED